MLAVAVADVLVRNLDPGIALRLGDHALDEAAVALLDVGAAGQLGLGLADPDQERVAHPLELGRPQDARAAHGADRPVDVLARKGRSPKLRELLLEACDLAAKLVADRAVVRGDEKLQRHVPPVASGFRLVSERFSHRS